MKIRVYIAEIGIIILGAMHIYFIGDGEIFRLCLMALGILGGVDLVAARLAEKTQ